MRTVSAVLARAREILQDDLGTRYSDTELVAHLVDALETCRTVRPDLFVTQYGVALPDTLQPTDFLPVTDHLFAAIGLYVSGMAELRDDAFAVDGRAMTISAVLARKLTSGA